MDLLIITIKLLQILITKIINFAGYASDDYFKYWGQIDFEKI